MFRKVAVPKLTKVERPVLKAVGHPLWMWAWALATAANFVVALALKPSRHEELVLLALAAMWIPAGLITERAYRKLVNTCLDMVEVNREMLDHIRRQDDLLARSDNVIHLFRVQAGMAPDQRPS